VNAIFEFLTATTFVVAQEKNVIGWNREMNKKTEVCKEDILGQKHHAYALLC